MIKTIISITGITHRLREKVFSRSACLATVSTKVLHAWMACLINVSQNIIFIIQTVLIETFRANIGS